MQRLNPRRDAHRHGEDVVDQERGCRDESGHLAEILPCDDVRTAAARIRMKSLAIREDDDREDRGDDRRNGAGQRQRADVDENEDSQDFFGGVRDRRKRSARTAGR